MGNALERKPLPPQPVPQENRGFTPSNRLPVAPSRPDGLNNIMGGRELRFQQPKTSFPGGLEPVSSSGPSSNKSNLLGTVLSSFGGLQSHGRAGSGGHEVGHGYVPPSHPPPHRGVGNSETIRTFTGPDNYDDYVHSTLTEEVTSSYHTETVETEIYTSHYAEITTYEEEHHGEEHEEGSEKRDEDKEDMGDLDDAASTDEEVEGAHAQEHEDDYGGYEAYGNEEYDAGRDYGEVDDGGYKHGYEEGVSGGYSEWECYDEGEDMY